MDYSVFKDSPGFISKGEPRQRTQGRKKRTEAAVKRDVRALVAERDPSCRTEGMFPRHCAGRLEWAHLRPRTRAQTRGMSAEERHTTAYTAMLCESCHDLYDASVFDIVFLTDEAADGPIEVARRS